MSASVLYVTEITMYQNFIKKDRNSSKVHYPDGKWDKIGNWHLDFGTFWQTRSLFHSLILSFSLVHSDKLVLVILLIMRKFYLSVISIPVHHVLYTTLCVPYLQDMSGPNKWSEMKTHLVMFLPEKYYHKVSPLQVTRSTCQVCVRNHLEILWKQPGLLELLCQRYFELCWDLSLCCGGFFLQPLVTGETEAGCRNKLTPCLLTLPKSYVHHQPALAAPIACGVPLHRNVFSYSAGHFFEWTVGMSIYLAAILALGRSHL